MPVSDDEDDVPLATLHRKAKIESDSDDDDDVPIASKRPSKQPTSKQKRAKKASPVKQTKVKKEASKPAKKAPKAKKEPKVKKETKLKKESPVKAEVKAELDLDDDDTYKWWENEEDLNGEIKWHTLSHSGVIFPPEYEPLPKSVKLIYNGQPVSLPPQAEEVAGFYGAMLETDHAKNPVFCDNFFHDFLEVLEECGGCPETKITAFKLCDFTKMYAHFQKEREAKKAVPPQERKRIREERAKDEEKYKFCYLDGRKEQVGNFRIEPPGLFRGRGAHPKTGKLKRRVYPEQVVLNLGEEAAVPEPPKGHKWGEVRHDNTVAWLATWRENISNSNKYVRFANNSSLKGISDFKKFEKARALKGCIDEIRKDYRDKLRSHVMQERQIATATYLIDVFALRAGGEKSEDEADTVGCCSLRYEHIFLKPPSTVVFDFLGKDSVRFYQEVEVDKQVFKNLKIFKREPKKPGDDLFDRLDPSVLNKYFQSFLPGLTAKVFRTYNASKTMQEQLDKIPNKGTVNEKVVAFNAANREVAILCNHQRNVSKGFEAGVQKMESQISELKWKKIRLKRMMLQLDKKLRKKKPEYFAEIESLSKEDERKTVDEFLEKEKDRNERWEAREKQKLDWEKKHSDKAEWASKKEAYEADKKKRAERYKNDKKEFHAELRSHKYEISSRMSVEKLEAQVVKLEERIKNAHLQLKDREDNSSVALSTSKVNYIDPRLPVVFAKKYGVPMEKLFTKALREKFAWAIESADKDWRF